MIIKLEFENRQEHNEYCLHVVKGYTNVQTIPLLEYKRLEEDYNKLNNLYSETKIKLFGWEKFYKDNKRAMDDLKNKDKLFTNIEHIGLSERTFRSLKRKNIDTLKVLCSLTEEELLSIENFGRKALNEVKTSLSGFHLELATTKEKL